MWYERHVHFSGGELPRNRRLAVAQYERWEMSSEKAFRLVEENTYSVISFDDRDASGAGIKFKKNIER